MKNLFVIILALTLSLSVFAQAPEKMSYQAVIRDVSNNLITNTTVGVKVSVLQGSSTGSAVYIETHTPTTNINGLASFEIGGGIPVSGNFSIITWGNNQYFIKVETDPAGGTNYTIAGTTQLISVPYALHAKTTENTIWSLNGNKAYYNDGNIGIGTSSPSSNLEIKAINGVGADLFMNSGNLNSSVGVLFRAYRSTLNFYSEGELRLLNTNKFVFQKNIAPNSPTTLMTIELSNGNVGIGQTNSSSNPIMSKLQVKGGDVYIEDIATGVIMKSPNGQCWRATVDNTGAIVTTMITCP